MVIDGEMIGTCSLCGGVVVALGTKGWWSVTPPPPPTCRSCGAVAKGWLKVIPMEPAPTPHPGQAEIHWNGNGTRETS